MVTFCENVLVKEGDILRSEKVRDNISIKRCSTPKNRKRRKMAPSYTPDHAHAVAKRMENEIKRKNHLAQRVKAEIMADSLLQRQRMFQFVARVYRLTDQALMLLQRRLLINEKKMMNQSVPRFSPY